MSKKASKLNNTKTLNAPHHTFNTLDRERSFSQPSQTGSDFPVLHELVAPHVESFNRLFKDSDGGPGLLDKAIEDIPSRVIFDGNSNSGDKWGNRLERT